MIPTTLRNGLTLAPCAGAGAFALSSLVQSSFLLSSSGIPGGASPQ
jgi:hypothetical protein